MPRNYVWYDVCNDYSLELRTLGEPDNIHHLEEDKLVDGLAYYFDEDEGYIYFLGEPGLSGAYLNLDYWKD